ncbi:MAG: triphosphoribosyl-dephospho-CoA synthase [Acidobacteriaceae bacterium]|nr:triphosphoribosyl-dephospho-CoA synthase [Acidobacteriaceae bacterium]
MKEFCLSTPAGQPAAAELPDAERSALLGALARQALVAEAELTPKPGLVDRRGSGAHSDLWLDVMRRSALAIEPFISRIAFQSANERPSASLRAKLAATGRAAERAMLRVSRGCNTHKGAIWTLGLLAASAATTQSGLDAFDIASTAGVIASFEDSQIPKLVSHGQIVAQEFGVTGARGEARQGFPHIIGVGLPMLRARRDNRVPEQIARLDALLSIMAELDDTCLLYRGGEAALRAAKNGASAVIRTGGAGFPAGRERLRAMDRLFLELGVSPGGSADLLAGTLFLDAVERGEHEIQPDESMLEEDCGTVRI